MYKVGVFPGKFLPPHRGHLNSIFNAATQCEKLYVVVSDHPEITKNVCEESGIRLMDMRMRAKWLSIELQKFDHIQVLMLDEKDISPYPDGYKDWSNLLYRIIPEKFNVIFGGENDYKEPHKEYFPNVEYVIFDPDRKRYPISATEIRSNPLKHWDYILGSARSHFVKRVLLTGSESCGKTTMAKYLAKIFHTSWAEEEGRYYSARYLGGNEEVFALEDFGNIAIEQYQAENHALKTSNKVVFFDTDAVVTQFYSDLYLNKESDLVENFIDSSRYDLVLCFAPDVKWIDDGLRWNSDDRVRRELHKKLKLMYKKRGFAYKIKDVNGSYNERLNTAIRLVENLLAK